MAVFVALPSAPRAAVLFSYKDSLFTGLSIAAARCPLHVGHTDYVLSMLVQEAADSRSAHGRTCVPACRSFCHTSLRPTDHRPLRRRTAESTFAPAQHAQLNRHRPPYSPLAHLLEAIKAPWNLRRSWLTGHKSRPVEQSSFSSPLQQPRACWAIYRPATACTPTRRRKDRLGRVWQQPRSRPPGGSRAAPLGKRRAWSAACSCHRGRCPTSSG